MGLFEHAPSRRYEEESAFASSAFKIVFASLALLFTTQLCGAQNAPQVLKVDPPSWWANHTINPVRLLIKGTNLRGARVTGPEGLRFGA
ncbi:MAG TPA: hypothetical protein VNF70_01160, partial [Pyrinomonadaceae bacterium]|nr:hypothetical protein [Pyrinomonadaceae bacterium]